MDPFFSAQNPDITQMSNDRYVEVPETTGFDSHSLKAPLIIMYYLKEFTYIFANLGQIFML